MGKRGGSSGNASQTRRLKTVRVPDAIAPAFLLAEEVVSRYFGQRRDDPEHGAIEIAGERYVLVRAASLSVEFFSLVRQLFGADRAAEADEFARNILYDLAHSIGRSDAHNFHSRMELSDPIARLSAGPVHFAHAGWAFVTIDPSSSPSADEDFYLLYDHPYSFEAEAWMRSGQVPGFAACIMGAGYSSGWCEASFGVKLVACEVLCRAKEDPCCRFVMAHPSRVEDRVRGYLAAQELSHRTGTTSQHAIPDLFARKRIEEELRETRDALERRVSERTGELVRANELLRAEMQERQKMERRLAQNQRLEAVGRLAGGIAHDFNNLMGVVIGNAGLLARRLGDDDPAKTLADDILGAGNRAAELTRQLLTFSRSQVSAPDVFPLSNVVGGILRMLSRLVGDEIVVTTQLDDGAGAIEADPVQLEQVVMNLVVNARDAMPRGGNLRVLTDSVEVAGPRAAALGVEPGFFARLVVEDDGVGMDAHTRSRMFEPFFTTKAASGGTGLGLSTVYGIVGQSRGAIDVTSELGKGTRFEIFFPRIDPPAPPSVAPSMESLPHGKETVLVCEDQPALRKLVRRVLGELGYRVLVADDASHAIEIAEVDPSGIDLLVTDVVMPEMRGPELADRVRAKWPRARVLYMSGYFDGSEVEKPGHEGMLAKPFSSEALAGKVRRLLDG